MIFLPKNVWAVTDYDGNGIITHDEKKRYYLEVYGVDMDAPDAVEQMQNAMDTLSEKYNTDNTNNTSNSGADNASETEKSNANKASNSDKKNVEKPKTADSSPKKETPTPSYTSTVTKEPTCTEEGEKTYTSDLGDSYTEVIPALGHKPGDWTTEKEPTCTEEGKKVRYCTVCG